VTDRVYSKFFQYVVKFPDDVEPPDAFKPADEYDDYIGVEEFNTIMTPPEGRALNNNGFSGNVIAMPLIVTVHPNLAGKVKPLVYKGKKPDWEVKLKQLAKEDKGKPSVAYDLTLTGVEFKQVGPNSFQIDYDRFVSLTFATKGAPDRDGYDVLAGEYLG
jgi:hypothetical protein